MPPTTKFDQLPPEVLFRVFWYLDVPDIIRSRKVSRYLNQVSRHREVWAGAYRNADFVHPPGPFLSQSAHDLEDALTSSLRVDRRLRRSNRDAAQSKTTRCKLREIRYAEKALCVRLAFSRFVLIAFRKEIRCYDLNVDARDNNSGAVIYRPSSDRTLWAFEYVSAVSVDGHPFGCVVLDEKTTQVERQTRISIHSFVVGEQSEAAPDLLLLHQSEYAYFYIESVNLGPRVIVVQGAVGSGDCRVVAIDVHARTELLLPCPIDLVREAHEVLELHVAQPFVIVSTSTQLLLTAFSPFSFCMFSTLFNVFTLPIASVHDSSIPLSRSHRSIVSGIKMVSDPLRHDAIRDPSTEDTLITIQASVPDHRIPHRRLGYGVLRLSQPSSHDELGTITFQPLSPHQTEPPSWVISLKYPSFNGSQRVFYMTPDLRALVAHSYVLSCDGGDIGEWEVKLVKYPSVLRFPAARVLKDYDPYRGRICLQKEERNIVEIFDLAM